MDATTATTDKTTTKKRRPAAEEEKEEIMRPTSREAPAEEEVEEFYAILKRIHVAVKYFERSGAGDAGGLLSGKRWQPSFEKEDFVAEIGGGTDDDEVVVEEAGSEVEGAGLDLNSDPPPEAGQLCLETKSENWGKGCWN